MGTAATKTPLTTGFCSPSNPRTAAYDPHDRCPGSLPGVGGPIPCSCPCHTVQAEVVEEPSPAAGRAPGFYDDIDEADYHRDPASLSQSGAKLLLKAPALFRHDQQHPTTSQTFDFGHAAHRLVLGAGDPIEVLEFKDRRTTAYKEAEAAARAAGRIPLLRKDYDVVQAMADVLSTHTLAMELLSEGRPEVSAYAPDPETGVMRRCRFDWLGPTILSDYKSAESSDPAVFRRRVAEFGYHQQHPWYLDVARDLGHPAEAFAFIVQMKNPPYLVTVVDLVDSAVERGRDLNRQALQRYRDCTESGMWPGYVPDTAFASIDLPAWAYTDNDLEISA